MELFTRRLIAVAATSALVSVPAVALVANGGSASATSSTTSTSRATAPCRAVTPAGLLDGLGDLLGGLTGGLTGGTGSGTGGATGSGGSTGSTGSGSGSTSTSPDPLTLLAALLPSGSPTDAAGIEATLETILSALPDVTQSTALDALTTLKTGDPAQVPAALAQLQSILDLPVGLAALFPTGVPTEISDLFPSGLPTDGTDLLGQLTDLLAGLGATSVPPGLAGKLPPSMLTALNDALSKTATPPAGSGTATTKGACAVPPVTACRKAMTKVKALQKRLRTAKRRHHHAQARTLTTKLKHAKKAKRKAC